MDKINRKITTEYIRELTPENKGHLAKMEKYAEENNIPIIEPEVAQFIKIITKLKKPNKILEIGTAIGYSSLVMAKATEDSLITTLEIREDMVKLANDNVKKMSLEDRINIIHGDANNTLKILDEKYDLIFLDAAKGQYINFFNASIDLLANDGIIVSDNVLFKGMIADDNLVIKRKKTIVNRLRKYLKKINNTDGLTSSVIPLGDGIALTYREEK